MDEKKVKQSRKRGRPQGQRDKAPRKRRNLRQKDETTNTSESISLDYLRFLMKRIPKTTEHKTIMATLVATASSKVWETAYGSWMTNDPYYTEPIFAELVDQKTPLDSETALENLEKLSLECYYASPAKFKETEIPAHDTASDMFLKLHSPVVRCNQEGDGYYWDENVMLFKKINLDQFKKKIGRTLQQHMQDGEIIFLHFEHYKSFLRLLKTANYLRDVYKFVKGEIEFDEDFEKKINVCPNLFPIGNNQVLELDNFTVRERTRSDCFSKRRPLQFQRSHEFINETFEGEIADLHKQLQEEKDPSRINDIKKQISEFRDTPRYFESYVALYRHAVLAKKRALSWTYRGGLLRVEDSMPLDWKDENRWDEFAKVLCPHVWKLFKRNYQHVGRRNYMRRILGYCLSACQKDRSYYVLYGSTGSNGKSHLMELMRMILGEKENGFFLMAISDVLFKSGSYAASCEQNGALGQMRGMRLVVVDESSDYAELNVAQIKRLTGGLPVTARDLREKFSSFFPTHHIAVSCNSPFRIKVDPAITERTETVEHMTRYWTDASHLKPKVEDQDKFEFTDPETKIHSVKITKETEEFYEKMKTDYLDEFFLWLAMGCFEALTMIHKEGHRIYVPKVIKEDTRKFLEFHDPLKQFLEHIELATTENPPLKARDAHDAYVDLCTYHNQKSHLSEKSFLAHLENHSLYDGKRSADGFYYVKFYIPDAKKPESRRKGFERKTDAQRLFDLVEITRAKEKEKERKAKEEKERKNKKIEKEAKDMGQFTLHGSLTKPVAQPSQASPSPSPSSLTIEETLKFDALMTQPTSHKTQDDLDFDLLVNEDQQQQTELEEVPDEFLY